MKIMNNFEAVKEETYNRVPVHGLINFDEPDGQVKVSIVMPVCNVEQYLRKCLNSAINQTLEDIEIICVNDGSTDGSLDILKEYAYRDKRVKVIDKNNAGYGHAMNIGMDMACGEYIAILESDDYIHLNMMEELYSIAVENDADMVKGDFYRFTSENGFLRLFYCRLSDDDTVYNHIINVASEKKLYKFANTWAGIYKRSFLCENNIRHHESPGASFQDNGFWYLSTVLAQKIIYVDKPYYFNRRDNPNSSVYQLNKAYLINGEYNYISSKLKSMESVDDDIYPYLFQKKFDAYKFNYRRIDSSLKKDYIFNISQEYKRDLAEGLMNASTLSTNDRNELNEILEDPEGYYNRTSEDINFSYSKEETEGVVYIAFICDDGYVIPTATAIRSLLRHKKTATAYDITIVGLNLSDQNIRKLTYVNKPNASISVVQINDEIEEFKQFKPTAYGVSNSALVKFILPSIFNANDKLLYLDGDIAVMKDLYALYMTDISDVYAGVVRDMPQVLYEKQIFGIKYGCDYFNSGVLLLNLKAMRMDEMQNKLIAEKMSSTSRLMDQDVFNELFQGHVKQLPITNNTLYVNLIRSKGKYSIGLINRVNGKKYKSLEDLRRDSRIIHYCSEDKPWKYYDTPMADYWLFIYSMTKYDKKLKRISIQDQCKEGILNGKIEFADETDHVAICFMYNEDNTSEIIKNIVTLENNNDGRYYEYYIFYDGKVILDTGLFDTYAKVNMVYIGNMLIRDREYSVDGKLDKNYYRMLIPEILCQYDKCVIIDGCLVNENFSPNVVGEMDEQDMMYMVKTSYRVTFWESPLIVINIPYFIREKIKFKYWENYRKNRRPGKSIAMALGSVTIARLNWYYTDIKETEESQYNSYLQQKLSNECANLKEQLQKEKEKNQGLTIQFKDKDARIDQLEYELYATRTSFSCRLGLFLTALPRRLFRRKKEK